MPKRQVPKPLLNADPDLLQIIGTVADLLGLGEHIQRLLPIDRVRVQRRRRRITNLRDSFSKGLSEARTALRALATTIPSLPAAIRRRVLKQASQLKTFARDIWLGS